MTHALVMSLLEACPFLRTRLGAENLDLPTVVFGSTARALIARELPTDQEDLVFAYLNDLAERGDADEILATGAIELFNDTPDAQALARSKLSGRALAMLEDLRAGWGQPDYGPK